MMDYPLTLTHFFERSRRLFAKKGLATRVPGAPLFRYTYADFAERVCRLAGALRALGIERGERVGTLAWNSHRHLELYWAAPLLGAVLHTVNIRLSAQDLTYIINHAGDAILFVDASLWPVIEPIRKELPSVRQFVVMPDAPVPAAPGLREYEALVCDARPVTAWPALDENDAAGMCYTSGTTGHPKGVVYSHRAIFLHSMAVAMADTLGISERDVILHVVPMFHANAWCVPFAGVMAGATQIFAGPNPQPRDLASIIQDERVTFVGAVPTVWIAVKEIVEKEGFDLSSVRCIPIGGSAAPRSLIEAYEKKFGVSMTHAWGMTEMTPLGTVSRLKSYMEAWPDEQRYAVRAKQGYAAAGVEIRAVDEAGREVPWDGKTIGELQVRGPWVVKAYYENPESAKQFTPDGWFRTGDVVSIDPEGYIQITDRTKDLIKSGGEWISSVDMESLLMAHPKVLEAAVIAVPHAKWVERPLACVVPRPEHRVALTAGELLDFLRPQVAKWALPDGVVFLDAIPKTSVGKFDKKVLREQFKTWQAEP
ncbi:MAG: long-chain fatty acid--CoA ligase [Candidatus Rokubacteria bacterium]|nr:long-chain fatty acid--CoA ligase [Candidatus Rokubacteria bacterium]